MQNTNEQMAEDEWCVRGCQPTKPIDHQTNQTDKTEPKDVQQFVLSTKWMSNYLQ